jgi:hypothetical protein
MRKFSSNYKTTPRREIIDFQIEQPGALDIGTSNRVLNNETPSIKRIVAYSSVQESPPPANNSQVQP